MLVVQMDIVCFDDIFATAAILRTMADPEDSQGEASLSEKSFSYAI